MIAAVVMLIYHVLLCGTEVVYYMSQFLWIDDKAA